MDIKNISPQFTDDRGEITRLFDIPGSRIKSVLLIHSKKGSVRANHYHQHDTHFAYLLSGRFEYFEKPSWEDNKISSQVIDVGQLVTTMPKVIHAMKFYKDSILIVFTTEPRNQVNYEKDTIRVKLV
ncbi:MAG: hypothetical protein AAB874_00885 [Patescibacteria group bacterium]